MMRTTIISMFVLSFVFVGEASLTLGASFDLPNIPCPQGLQCPTVTSEQVATNPAAYIARLYQIVLAIAGVLAVGIIVVGSLFYTFAGGSTDRQREGKEMITSALWGIALLFGSYLILNTVNPNITERFGVIGGEKVKSRTADRYSIAEDRLRNASITGEAVPPPLTEEELKKVPQDNANRKYCTAVNPAPPSGQLKACIIRGNCAGCVSLDSDILTSNRVCQWGSEGKNCLTHPKTNTALLRFVGSLAGQGVAYRLFEAFPPVNPQVSVGHYNGCSVDVSVWSSGTKSQCEAVVTAIQKAQAAGFYFYNEYSACGPSGELAHTTGNLLHLTTIDCP